MKWRDLMICVLVAAVLLTLAWCSGERYGYRQGQCNYDSMSVEMPVEHDTIEWRDTVYIERPRYINTLPMGVRYITLPRWVRPDTVTVNDSVDVAVAVEQRRYQGDDYEAWVSGVDPQLDSLHIMHRGTTITETRYVTQWKKKRWGVSLTAGYGMTPHGMQPYVGVGVSYTLITF